MSIGHMSSVNVRLFKMHVINFDGFVHTCTSLWVAVYSLSASVFLKLAKAVSGGTFK